MTGGAGATEEAVTCMACGRLLHDEESKRLRIGPHCLKRLQARLTPRPRRRLTQTAATHPKAIPARDPVALELWGDDEDGEDDDDYSPGITDVPTGALL